LVLTAASAADADYMSTMIISNEEILNMIIDMLSAINSIVISGPDLLDKQQQAKHINLHFVAQLCLFIGCCPIKLSGPITA